jgi:hypothetical protein
MLIFYITSTTSELSTEIINKLTQTGSIVTGIGFLILAIGLIRGFRGNLSGETSAILTTGANVTVIGISTVISGRGHGNESVIHAGAWVAVSIGIMLIIIYSILRITQLLREK